MRERSGLRMATWSVLILAAILIGSTGLDCDQNAQADFRDTATTRRRRWR